MLCIGRGLMSQPKMMLLDEPSAALAPQIVLDIFRTIGRICRDGMTLLLVEQNVRMALLLAEYAYVLRDGVVHIEGSAEALIDDDAVRLSYLGGTVAAAAPRAHCHPVEIIAVDYFIDLVIVGISIGMVYGLVALGISFIYSGLDIVHFAHGEIYMIGAFLGVTALHLTGLNYPALILIAMVLTGIIGVVIERVFYRRLTSQGGGISFAGMGIIIAGFGISMVLQNIAFLIWTARAVPFPVNFGLPLEIGDLMLPRSYLWIVGVTDRADG